MSLHSSVVMVKADARSDMREILEGFNYRPVACEKVQTWDAATAAMQYPRKDRPRTSVHKAVVFEKGWTAIIDTELVMFTDELACTALSQRYGAPVFTMVCEGTSGSYAFSLFDPDLKRAFLIGDSEIQDDRGEPLPQESTINLAELFETDVLELMTRFGLSYDHIEAATSFDIWELDESEISPPQTKEPTQPAVQQGKKPWWKVW